MRLLAVDTSTARASVALLDSGEVCAESRWLSKEGASSSLMPTIAFLLERAGFDALGASPLTGERFRRKFGSFRSG
jgi:tRNA A37 threonylcarbamoyladenosine modification protein TsaB